MPSKIRYFIPLAIAITCIYGFIYVAIQQAYRQNANDPQIEYSEQLANALATGIKPVNTQAPIDISKYLTQFIIIYDNAGKVTYSEATLDGKTPVLPPGVLAYTKTHGQDRVTWAPKSGVRIAAVITSFQSSNSAGFVLAGRNLEEVERRAQMLIVHTASAWFITLLAVFLSTLIFSPNQKKK